ncbi:MAG: B12-binding domain/radical SAM domain protein [Anaerolineaceae bacterium 4572_32.1]|nr:MAG: B12-binding domain/radical SAM domain protein [Anaerolineaceae bacterium 4572_32.1]
MPKSDLVFLHAPSVYDFRHESILYGPVSDLVPSTPVFEMYPIGFTALAEYLEQRGFRVRIINLAVRMLKSRRYDVEKVIRRQKPLAFGIDLHWMPHAHGAIEVARLVKKHHPDRPVILGGFSASFFHEELIARPEVDFVLRGDSTEEPLHLLMQHLASTDGHGPALADIPNLTWQDESGNTRVNPITYSPPNLDHVLLDYSYVVKAVARYRDMLSVVPFEDWLRYPVTAALSCRGCIHDCNTCGGSITTMREVYGRQEIAFRSAEDLARDVRSIARWNRGPVFVLGDIRQAGMDYAYKFLELVKGVNDQLMFEVFGPTPRKFLIKMAKAAPKFTLEISPESHDEEVRAAFGRHYSNAGLERTIEDALAVGCQRFDLFFMIGLPQQTYDSVMGTVDYCQYIMEKFNAGDDSPRVIPFISPFAPFLDPGSKVFMNPQAYGYRLIHRTLEEHRQALVQPSWKYVLNYETEWMNRDEIVAATYEAARRFNQMKARYALISPAQAEATEARIKKAVRLSRQIDEIMAIEDDGRRFKLLRAIKPQVDTANMSTVCDKRELEVPMGLLKLNIPRAAWMFLSDTVRRKRKAGTV